MMAQVRKDHRRPAKRGTEAQHRPAPSPEAAACRPGPIDALLTPGLFKALSDPTRCSLVACIAKCARGCNVTEIAACCAIDLSVVSRHLSLLADAGVLEQRKAGRTVFYHVRYAPLAGTLRSLADAIESCRPACGDEDCCTGGACAAPGCCGSANASLASSSIARPRMESRRESK